MSKYNPIYYLLFILLVMGTFASMAQNSYGLRIMGGVAFAFALIFLVQFISVIRKKRENRLNTLIETGCLVVLSVIFGFRVFYIYFPSVELLFIVAASLLALVYIIRMVNRFRHLQHKNNALAGLTILFHLSIILFLLSLAIFPFAEKIAEWAGIGAFLLLVVFIIIGLIKKEYSLEGEKISAFRLIRFFRDHSVIIGTLLLLISFYTGMNRAGLLPGIYSDEYPRVYFELLDDASSNKEKPEDGKYKYQEFMDKYQDFLQHNSSNK